jgi:hypothetical protein
MAFNPVYKIDLMKVFNTAYESKSAEFRRNLRPLLSDESFKKLFGSAVVERIIGRTEEKSIDKDGKAFKSYSKSYSDSEIFAIYNKSKYQVNLRLTGEMLDSLTSRNLSSSNIQIELDGDNNRAKAHGHIYRGGNLPKRDFLGLPQKDLTELMKKSIAVYKSEAGNEVDFSINLKGQIGKQEFNLSTDSIDTMGAEIGEV